MDVNDFDGWPSVLLLLVRLQKLGRLEDTTFRMELAKAMLSVDFSSLHDHSSEDPGSIYI